MRLSISCSLNPLTDALAEPGFGAPDFEIAYEAIPVMQLFARALADKPLDIVEFSLANHVMAVARYDRRYIGLPVFSFRGFRHSMIWVRSGGLVRSPEDLRGRRIGIAAYALTALVYVRGLLAEEYQVYPGDVEWIRTGSERVALPDLPHLTIRDRPGASLFQLLHSGEVDAIITFWSPEVKTEGVRRLFPDVLEVEADYYRRTKIYPIMHCFALSRELHEDDPTISHRIFSLFEKAKVRWRDELALFGAERASVTPWTPLDIERSEALLGPDLHPYGVNDNEVTLRAMVRFLREQNLISRDVNLNEIFVSL